MNFTFAPITKKTAQSIYYQMGYVCRYSGKEKTLFANFHTYNKPVYNDFISFYLFLKRYSKYDISSKYVKRTLKNCYLSRQARIHYLTYFADKITEKGINFQIEEFPF